MIRGYEMFTETFIRPIYFQNQFSTSSAVWFCLYFFLLLSADMVYSGHIDFLRNEWALIVKRFQDTKWSVLNLVINKMTIHFVYIII